MPRRRQATLAGIRGPSVRCSTSRKPPSASPPSIHEHHGLAAVEDHTVVQMIADRARQHAAFDVAPLADQIVGRIAMADALDVLVDDRALIEVAGDVMRGSTDQLDAALKRLVIGPRALETRQERVVDVDAASRKL